MGLPVIYVFTHDSFAVGEDGPTHQAVEQLINLRGVPNLTVIRPADAAETVEAWRAALLNRQGPTALIFTRQDVPILNRQEMAPASGLQNGGYVLWDSSMVKPEIVFIATGSEVSLALAAARILAAQAIRVRVVSMPSWERFDAQTGNTAAGSCLPQSEPGWRWRRHLPGLGTLRRLDGASSPWTGLGPAPPSVFCASSSGSRRSRLPKRPKISSDKHDAAFQETLSLGETGLGSGAPRDGSRNLYHDPQAL
jgi:hypothetical protein